MSQSLKQRARRRALEQIQKRHDELAAREARIREIVIEATTAAMQREVALARAAECIAEAVAELDAIGVPVAEAAVLCGIDVREAVRCGKKRAAEA